MRDQFRYLKGIDGTVQIQSGLEVTGTSSYLKPAVLTTAQRDVLAGTAQGWLIWNSTKRTHEAYGTGWAEIVEILGTSVQGDIPIRTGTGWDRLAAGTSGQLLMTQGAGANPAWGPAAAAITTYGTYTGDGTANRAIPHGLGMKPKLVQIIEKTGVAAPYIYLLETSNDGAILRTRGSGSSWNFITGLTAMDATNFYVGKTGAYSDTANYNTGTYSWTAWA